MKYLLIDTNIYLFCSFGTTDNYAPELLRRIKEVLDQEGVCLLVPEVVELEYRRNVRQQAKQYEQGVDAALAAAREKLQAESDRAAIDSEFSRIKRDRRAAARQAQIYFDEILAHAKTRRIEIIGDDVARALSISIAGSQPSKGKTATLRADIGEGEPGYAIEPDCLIVAAATRYLHESGAKPTDVLVVCSDNLKDFGEWRPDLQAHTLAPSIAALAPCESRYHVGLDGLLEGEFEGMRLTPDERAKYAEAAEVTRISRPQEVFRWLVTCHECGSEGEVESASGPTVCPQCGGPYEVEPLGPKAEPQLNALLDCPTCGNQLQVRVMVGRERVVRRWCLRCMSRLQYETASGDVTVLGVAEPVDSSAEGRDRGLLVLVCPECGRRQKSFARTDEGYYFAYCGNPDHGDKLLRHSRSA